VPDTETAGSWYARLTVFFTLPEKAQKPWAIFVYHPRPSFSVVFVYEFVTLLMLPNLKKGRVRPWAKANDCTAHSSAYILWRSHSASAILCATKIDARVFLSSRRILPEFSRAVNLSSF